jgi:uncharacterized membrane protein YhdT
MLPRQHQLIILQLFTVCLCVFIPKIAFGFEGIERAFITAVIVYTVLFAAVSIIIRFVLFKYLLGLRGLKNIKLVFAAAFSDLLVSAVAFTVNYWKESFDSFIGTIIVSALILLSVNTLILKSLINNSTSKWHGYLTISISGIIFPALVLIIFLFS